MRYTFKEFQAQYPDDGTCLDKIMDMRYGGREFSCPGCGADSKFHRIAKRRAYSCQHCGHHVYPCVGTPFEKSRTPLTNWFFAMYLMTSTRHGVAAKELERQIGCTYKTAWRMAHELRKLMAQSDFHGPLSGHVEVDETIVGGRNTGRGRAKRMENKTMVFGMLERDGNVRAGPVPNARQTTLEPVILTNVVRGSTVSSDEHGAYKDLGNSGYRHGAVNHKADEFVRGIHHTNSIEGYWSQFKRSVRGTHIHISSKHMWKYVAEFSYRYNMRKRPTQMFAGLISGLSRPRLVDG
jgi:transposase-like protein